MPTRERLANLGIARGRWLARQFADEFREARLAAGLSQARVGAAAGLSQDTVSRIELAKPPYPDFVQAALVARIVGLELRVQCFPASGQLRDAAHVALIRRLLARMPSTVKRKLEAPAKPGDARAWDVLIELGAVRIGVVAETRIRDLQALLRREHRKQLDGGVHHILLLVADTRNNRRALEEAGGLIGEVFPLGTRAVMTRLARGEPINANGIAIL